MDGSSWILVDNRANVMPPALAVPAPVITSMGRFLYYNDGCPTV